MPAPRLSTDPWDAEGRTTKLVAEVVAGARGEELARPRRDLPDAA